MGGYYPNPKETEKELRRLRGYLKENVGKIGWKEEGELLDQIEMLKKDLRYARKKKQSCLVYSPHVLEMKIKYGWK
jgi:predicted metal-dependent TIM-barrel fold hydrolase